jgi:integrase
MHIQSYYSQALKSGRRDGKGGLSPQTVRHHDRVLHVSLKRARALRLIATNPVEDVTCPKVERKEIEVLDDDEALRLITAVRPTRLYVPIFLALATGMRRGELLGLRWSDVNLDGAELTVRQSLEQTKAGLRLKAPKTKAGRRKIALSGSVVDVLRQHKISCLQERVALGIGSNPKAPVFGRPDNGEAQSPRDFSKAFSRIAARAGLGHFTLHALRHTHITNLLREGVHPKIASERAGHSSISVTLDIYSHAVPGLQEDAAARIDGSLARLLEH